MAGNIKDGTKDIKWPKEWFGQDFGQDFGPIYKNLPTVVYDPYLNKITVAERKDRMAMHIIPNALASTLAYMCGGKAEDILSVEQDTYTRKWRVVTKTSYTVYTLEQIARVYASLTQTAIDYKWVSAELAEAAGHKVKQKSWSIAVIAGSEAEARYLADLMGWKADDWRYVSRPDFLWGLRNESIYIYGTARDRTDFVEIESVLSGRGHRITDMME